MKFTPDVTALLCSASTSFCHPSVDVEHAARRDVELRQCGARALPLNGVGCKSRGASALRWSGAKRSSLTF